MVAEAPIRDRDQLAAEVRLLQRLISRYEKKGGSNE